ncbi:unnamed protein product [Prorocentrum cordatum]|uniref:ZZ-type domain-containing protein n=1 Tax=Prorocentrum cordatum TaxID=2364126 RepID=A0ABN9VHB9_9DINO|nr:unnamed protein product [Polarella glacialis]
MPHPHEMRRQEAVEALAFDFARAGRPRFQTNKICDNCGTRIYERVYFHCSEGCDIDFCQDCHQKSQEVLDACLSRSGDPDRESMHARLWWVIDTVERIGGFVLHTSAAARGALARELAFEWSTEMFEQLVQAAVDVVNAKVVHVQDVKDGDIKSDERFWHAVGWLQFLYSANSLPCETHKLDEQGTRGPKVEYERFILEGINKCEPISEFKRWQHHQSAKVPGTCSPWSASGPRATSALS